MDFSPPPLPQEILSPGIIPFLRRLVATQKKQNDSLTVKGTIDPVTWTVIDPQFPHPFAHGTVISQVAEPDPIEAQAYLCPAGNIPESGM